MPISISAARMPQADGKVQLPPPAAVVTQQPKDDATGEPPAGNE